MITLISTVRAYIGDLRRFVDHHRPMVDRILLFFDDPQDECISQIDADSVVCNDKYWGGQRPFSIEERQFHNVNYGMSICGTKWVVHIDSDELLVGDLKGSLRGDVVVFDMEEAVPEKLHYESIFDATLFRRRSGWLKTKLAQHLCKRAVYGGRYFRGHDISKCAVRRSNKIKSIGNHRPVEYSNIESSVTRDVTLQHYDCIGIENWLSKWRGRYEWDSYASELSGSRLAQMYEYASAVHDGRVEEVYRNLHFLPESDQRTLFRLGMLARR